MKKGINELDALLAFLKERSVNQSDLNKTGKFRTPTGKFTDVKEAYVSRAKNDPNNNYYELIINHLKEFFSLKLSSVKDSSYQFEIVDDITFSRQVNKITSDRRGREETKIREEAKSEYFANTQWQLFTRTSRGIHRHAMTLLPNYIAEIKNAEQGKDYRGEWSFDETKSYLILNMSHFKTMDKALHMLFYVGTGENPSLCLGGYINTGDTGGRVYAATAVTVIVDALLPVKLIPWEEIEVEGYKDDIPPIIAKYLAEKHLNGLSTPGKGIRSLESLEDWWTKKNLSLKDEKLRSYTGYYKVFFQDEEKMKTLDLTIYETDKQIKGELSEPDDDPMKDPARDFGIGVVTRYEKTLSLMCQSYGRPVYLQMSIGGPYTKEYECYCGIVTGLTYTDEELVAYPIVIVKGALLEDAVEAVKLLQTISRAVEVQSKKTIYASSPRRFKIDNL